MRIPLSSHTLGRAVICAIWAVLAVCFAQTAQKKEKKEKKEKVHSADDFRLEFSNRPVLRVGDWLTAEFTGRVQTDFRGFSPDIDADEGLFELRRLRVGIQGRVFDDFEFEVEAAPNETGDDTYWRDVYLNYRGLRDAQLQVGRFKIPFGREQLTSAARLDFINRSRISNELAPARDTGAVLHGRFFQDGLGYDAGYFLGDGDNAWVDGERRGKAVWAGRVIGAPLRLLPLPGAVQSAEFGFAAVRSSVAEGEYSLRGRSVGRETFFPRVFVKGARLRLGVDGEWRAGPVSLKGEFMHARTERLGQAITGGDLPPLIARGWYAAGTWLLTGERKASRVEPASPFLIEGIGAVEIAARYEQIRFFSATSAGVPLRNPRASSVRRQSDRVWTYGVNWYLNRWGKIQANAVHETIEDAERAMVFGQTRYWMWIARLQFSM
jgi:phosphate-selective porin OprO/OprP